MEITPFEKRYYKIYWPKRFLYQSLGLATQYGNTIEGRWEGSCVSIGANGSSTYFQKLNQLFRSVARQARRHATTDFSAKLRPVSFRWDMRDDHFDKIKKKAPETGEVVEKLVSVKKDGLRQRQAFHHGLIAP